jgi:hypothetical protein
MRNALFLPVNAENMVSLFKEVARDRLTDPLGGSRNQNVHFLFLSM